jgi:hypothetical protein
MNKRYQIIENSGDTGIHSMVCMTCRDESEVFAMLLAEFQHPPSANEQRNAARRHERLYSDYHREREEPESVDPEWHARRKRFTETYQA